MDFIDQNEDISQALEASSVTKSTKGKLWKAYGFHTNASLRYIQFFQASSLPTDGTIPWISIPLSQYQTFDLDYTNIGGTEFTTGLVWCLSTTAATKTIGASEAWVRVEFS